MFHEIFVVWKFNQHIMYNIEIHKALKNGPKNLKNVPSSKRGEHVEYKYIIKNEFFVF